MKHTLAHTAASDLEAAIALETEATIRGITDPETKLRIAEFSKR
jgi:hypothetical protein